MGARAEDVRRLVLRQGRSVALLGIFVGLLVAAVLSRVLKSMLFGVQSIDMQVYASSSVVLLIAVLAAALVPAQRASRADPMDAIRAD